MTDDFSAQLIGVMKEYADTLEEDVREILTEVGREARQKVSSASPERTGRYAKGWRVKKSFKKGKYEVTVHNSRYQLTHLLENGHRNRNGEGWVAAQPHIGKVNEWAQQELEKRIKEAAEQ